MKKAVLATALVLFAAAAIVVMIDRGPRPDRQLVYARTEQGDLSLHVFDPPDHRTPAGALVLFHGGGWEFGEPERMYAQAEHFAELGLVTISVEYRTAERHGTQPIDAMRDGVDALRYVRREAEALGIDPERIAAGGSSAGAQIAAIVSTHGPASDIDEVPEDPVSPRPDALVLIEPVYDNSPTGYGNARIGENWEELSPLHTIGQDMAPAIVFFGSRDGLTPLSSAESFRAQMQEVGVRSELTVFPGGNHGFLNSGTPGAEAAYEQHLAEIEEFLSSLGWFD